VELVKALTAAAPNWRMSCSHGDHGDADYILPEYEGHFRHNALFIGGSAQGGAGRARGLYADFPAKPRSLHSKVIEIDVPVACTRLTLRVYESGAEHDASLTAAQCARHVIVEINGARALAIRSSM
jgi:hypothetical protein